MSNGYSLEQLREALWTAPGARVHAIVDGLVVPGIAATLKASDVAGWDCLHRGALGVEAARAAPYLTELKAESPFTEWILGEASATYPGWGVLSVSTLPMLPMREHCRSLGEVVTPSGERTRWRWYDPDVLTAVLPSMLAGQLDDVFASGQSIVLPRTDAWTWHALDRGVLTTEIRPLLRRAA